MEIKLKKKPWPTQATALSFPTILFTPSSRLDIIFSRLNTVTGIGFSTATYTSGEEESAETEWASSLWQLRNHCIHSCHWDLPTLMLKFVPPEWVSPLDYEEENSGPIRSVLVGSSSPVEAQPLGDWSPPGLVTEWLVSVPALPGPQAPHLEDEQTPFMSAPSESQHLHLTPSRSPAFCWKPLPWSSSVLRAAVLSSLPPAQFSMTGWLHDTCWPHL